MEDLQQEENAEKRQTYHDRDSIFKEIRYSIRRDEDVVEEAILHELPEEILGKDKDKLILKKRFGLFGCISSLVGTVIGLGVFTMPYFAVKAVGNVPTVLMFWAFYGIVMALGAFCYLDIARAVPGSGGDLTYLLEFYGSFGACFYQVAINLFIGPVLKATLAISTAVFMLRAIDKEATEKTDFSNFHDDFYFGATCLAILVILLSVILCSLSTRLIRWLSEILLGIKCTALLLIVGISLYAGAKHPEIFKNNMGSVGISIFPDSSNNGSQAVELSSYSTTQQKMYGVYTVTSGAALAYQGWGSANCIMEEYRRPSSNLKMGTVISVPIICFVNLSIFLCYSVALTTEELMVYLLVPSGLFTKWIPMKQIQWLMPVLVGISIFGTLLNYTNALARVPFVGARNGLSPQSFGYLHLSRFTPIPSLILQSIPALIYVPLGLSWLHLLLLSSIYLEILFTTLVVAGYIHWHINTLDNYLKKGLIIPFLYVILTLCILLLPFLVADWTFKSLWSWEDIIVLSVSLLLILTSGGLIYYSCITNHWIKRNCFRYLDDLTIRIFKKIFILGQENDSVSKLLEIIHERNAGGVISPTITTMSLQTTVSKDIY